MSHHIDSLASREQPQELNSKKIEALLPAWISLDTEMKNKLDKLSQAWLKEIIDSITPIINWLKQSITGIDKVVWIAIEKLLRDWLDKLIPR